MTASYSGTITNNSAESCKLTVQGSGTSVEVQAGQSQSVSGAIGLNQTLRFEGKPGASAALSGTVDNSAGTRAMVLTHDPAAAGPSTALASADAGLTAAYSASLLPGDKVWLLNT